MNRVLLGIFTVALGFAVAQSLQCYDCDGVWGLCITSIKTCGTNQLCYSGVGTAVGFIKVTTKGCLEQSLCNQTTDTQIPTISNSTVYKVTKTCCSIDLCNAAPGLHTLSLLLLSLLSVFLAKVLV
ncbi:sperm acrosome membrane-associated protein 4-like [Brachyhypopomus gauderio]|uniref:sperm acrosome membrane-associated protein 4-like n=1 Tax=Brachyhypopomus gauderio TaxID=698409 RepID=UPI0040430660